MALAIKRLIKTQQNVPQKLLKGSVKPLY